MGERTTIQRPFLPVRLVAMQPGLARWLPFGFGAVWFAYRCLVIPLTRETSDLVALYCGLRAAWMGSSPYSLVDLVSVANAAGITYPYEIANVQWPLFFRLLEPLGALSYGGFKAFWLVSSLGCFALLVRAALRHWDSGQRLIVATLLLFFAPVHTTFGVGQIVLWQAAALILAMRFLTLQRGPASAFAFAVATVLKPQNTIAIVPVALTLRGRARWLGAGAFLVALGVVCLADFPDMVARLAEWSRAALTHAGLLGAARADLLNVTLTEALRFSGAGGATWLLGAAAAAGFVVLHRPGRMPGDTELLALTSFVVGYAVIYHRFYDLTLLLAFSGAFPSIWKVLNGNRPMCALLVVALAFNWQALSIRLASMAGIDPVTLDGAAAAGFSLINWAQTIVLLCAASTIYYLHRRVAPVAAPV